MAIRGDRSRYAWATPLTMLVAPGPRVDMQMPGLPVMSPQVEASMAPATSCFISRNRICRWRAASINSTDSPPGCPTMKGVPASLNADASTSTVVDIRRSPGICCGGNLAQFGEKRAGGMRARPPYQAAASDSAPATQAPRTRAVRGARHIDRAPATGQHPSPDANSVLLLRLVGGDHAASFIHVGDRRLRKCVGGPGGLRAGTARSDAHAPRLRHQRRTDRR